MEDSDIKFQQPEEEMNILENILTGYMLHVNVKHKEEADIPNEKQAV
mgnify:CR=1 FL=1